MSLPQFIQDVIYSQRVYVAPTFFKKAGVVLPRWNYYTSFTDAVISYNFLTGKSTLQPPAAAGAVPFNSNSAETIGINIDIFLPWMGSWYPCSYKYFREKATNTFAVIRFTKTDGSGPYFAAYSPAYMGVSATVAYPDGPGQQQALDDLYRECALLKYRYNALAAFNNKIRSLPQTPVTVAIAAQAQVKMVQMAAEMGTIQGVQFYYNKDGKIGFLPLLLIGAVVIFAGVTGWTVYKIIQEKEKTARINASYDVARWVDEKIIEVNASQGMTPQQKAAAIKDLRNTKDAALTVAENSTKENKGLFGNIASIVQWGVIGIITVTLIKASEKRTANA